ncbi:unnamed protein product, partial [Adineta steineri]
ELYPELTTPLSINLISQLEKKGIVEAGDRLSLIRYQTMTEEIFNEFLSLFKQTSSDVNQRQVNYPLFFQCAVSTNGESVKKVLQWIEKRFTNEQLIVIELFLEQLKSVKNKFPLEMLPNNFESIENIINIALNHLQQSENTLRRIINYQIFLLQLVEHSSNKEQKEKIQRFATKILKECSSKNDVYRIFTASISKTYPETRHILANILISDIFPKLISKSMLNELVSVLNSAIDEAWRLPQIDSFIDKFFTEFLPSSIKLQSSFSIDSHSTLISFYLKNRSTRFQRVNYLINKLDKLFFINTDVQQIAIRSQQHRQLIDQLIQDEKCFTFDKLSNEQSKFSTILTSSKKNMKEPGLNTDTLSSLSHLLTGKQQEHITNIILNDYLQDKEVSNLQKLVSFRILRRLTHTYNITLEWIYKKQDSPLPIDSSTEKKSSRNRGAATEPLDDILICLPSTFDLTPQSLIKHLEFLTTKLNASNAKYISDAMLSISRKIPDEIFLEKYLDFIQNEQFQKLGTSANKALLRLLVEYVSNTNLIKLIIKPIWNKRPHQDVRACLILTLLHFIGKTSSEEDENIIWEILEEATEDDYLPVVQNLFADQPGRSSGRGKSSPSWPLTKLKHSSENVFETFINRVQFKVLDHPTSLKARLWAWSNIDHEHCDMKKLYEKAQELCIQFDKDGNSLWSNAFEKILSVYKQPKTLSSNMVNDIVKKMISRREEIDSKENAIDNQHDLPVYHRIQSLLTILNSKINDFDNEKKLSFRSLSPIILQFDKTLSPQLAKLLIKTTQNKEELEGVLQMFQENLPKNYFERILTDISSEINNSHSSFFIQQLSGDEKLEVAQWFIKEKNRTLFVFDFLKNHVFNDNGVDREKCQNLLREIRKSDDLYLRQQAMEYTVPWKEDGDIADDNDDMSVSDHPSNENMS